MRLNAHHFLIVILISGFVYLHNVYWISAPVSFCRLKSPLLPPLIHKPPFLPKWPLLFSLKQFNYTLFSWPMDTVLFMRLAVKNVNTVWSLFAAPLERYGIKSSPNICRGTTPKLLHEKLCFVSQHLVRCFRCQLSALKEADWAVSRDHLMIFFLNDKTQHRNKEQRGHFPLLLWKKCRNQTWLVFVRCINP